MQHETKETKYLFTGLKEYIYYRTHALLSHSLSVVRLWHVKMGYKIILLVIFKKNISERSHFCSEMTCII